jgi:hypothetical protein
MTLEECSAVVAEVLLAWRVAPEGERLSGEALLRWRELPAIERRYFTALCAPYSDPHAFERTKTVTLNEAGDGCTITFSPPYPEPCDCGRPALVDFSADAVRCSRCLHAWPMKRALVAGKGFEPLRGNLLESVDRKDIGYAIERLPPEES